MLKLSQEATNRTEARYPRPVLAKHGYEIACGQAQDVINDQLKSWLHECVGCVAGRREFNANRYFAVNVKRLSDVNIGWRYFIDALERKTTTACLFVVEDPKHVIAPATPALQTTSKVVEAMAALAQIMSTLSDESAAGLVDGGNLNFVINLDCPVTRCRTTYCDFDAVAFVPGVDNPTEPLYDPLMASPVPIVNVSSDIYGFSMFARDYCLSKFGSEVHYLSKRERSSLFRLVCDNWQRIAETTINNYARMVDQSLFPTHLTEDKRYWLANHKDPAFAELKKEPYLHEMPVQYTERVVRAWERYFTHGDTPRFDDASRHGESPRGQCPMGVRP